MDEVDSGKQDSDRVSILLCTINAKYVHANLGLRYLRANLGSYRMQSKIVEFTIDQNRDDIVEEILNVNPKILGLGVYIWNLRESTQLVRHLKLLKPDLKIVLGGPEVSHESDDEPIVHDADVVLKGEADLEFRVVCEQLLNGVSVEKSIQCKRPPLSELKLPYTEYSDEDLKNRIIYVEASRGCPFQCEFCLSSLDEKVRSFDLELFLGAMSDLLNRGNRIFKFVDRTFNLKPATAVGIMEHFQRHWVEGTFLHFEMVPDRLPQSIRDKLPWFKAHALQFEIGIQSFTDEVGKLISRRMDLSKTRENFRFLRQETKVHTHVDLIIGLPGETMSTLESSFNTLWDMDPDEIQIGILKRLKGTPVARHSHTYQLVFSPEPPYEILSHRDFDFQKLMQLKRFARHFEIFVNGGRFPRTLRLLAKAKGDSAFGQLMLFSAWLWRETGQTHAIGLRRQIELLDRFMNEEQNLSSFDVRNSLADDIADPYCNPGKNKKGLPNFLHKPVSDRLIAHDMDRRRSPSA